MALREGLAQYGFQLEAPAHALLRALNPENISDSFRARWALERGLEINGDAPTLVPAVLEARQILVELGVLPYPVKATRYQTKCVLQAAVPVEVLARVKRLAEANNAPTATVARLLTIAGLLAAYRALSPDQVAALRAEHTFPLGVGTV